MGYCGSCTCGDVTFSITGEPIATRQCWCRQCQKIACGGPTHNAMFFAEDVDLRGKVEVATYVAASGNTVSHCFCAACGTQVFGTSSARSQVRTFRLGVFDTPHGLKPQMAIWTDEAPNWAMIDPELQQFPRQPPSPVKES